MLVIEFENKCSKERTKLIEDAVVYAASQLFPRIRKPVYINIEPIRNLATDKGVYGDVLDEEDREYTIRVDINLPPEQLITTILHEMVHVWQFLTKRMIYKWIHEVKFNKVAYPHDMPYEERPWEIEAHLKEKELWNGYSSSKSTVGRICYN